jgi:hypothetical protein
MRNKVKLPLMVRLASVQQVKTAAAEAALMSARAAENAARTAEEDALARTEAAQAEWGEHLSGAFSPEFSRALAAHVIERETAASSASLRRERSAELAERRKEEWQASEARSRSGKISLHRLRRRVHRRAEEDRLAEIADRITFDWSQK